MTTEPGGSATVQDVTEGADDIPIIQTRSLQALGIEINKRVSKLQREYLANQNSTPRAMLAQLRRAATSHPGSVPAVWDLTVDGLPGSPQNTSAAATHHEWAAHTALTLYATHQQSRKDPMHVSSVGLGQAIDRLAPKGSARRATVRRRFDAVTMASGFDAAAHHLRALVGQLRSANIPLDYGQLADDLLALQNPRRADDVRLRWARQYYRSAAQAKADDDTNTSQNSKDS